MEKIIKTEFQFEGASGRLTAADITYLSEKEKMPLVIFCHGYKGFKDWGCWSQVAEHFARAGFCFVKFNFSHNGGLPEDPIDFPDLNAFGDNRYSYELDDVKAILNYLAKSKWQQEGVTSTEQVMLVGHSRGGGVVLLAGNENENVHRIVTWAGVSDFESRFRSEWIDEWEKGNTVL